MRQECVHGVAPDSFCDRCERNHEHATLRAERDELRERCEALEVDMVIARDDRYADALAACRSIAKGIFQVKREKEELHLAAESAALEELAECKARLDATIRVVDHLADIMEIPPGAVDSLQVALGVYED